MGRVPLSIDIYGDGVRWGSTEEMKRTIIIGDIHGCYDELIALLKKCERKPSDEVISIGDMVDRGPKPWEVVEFF